jgi:hypothetical protein
MPDQIDAKTSDNRIARPFEQDAAQFLPIG